MCPSISDNNHPTRVEDSEREQSAIITLFLLLPPILILVISAATILTAGRRPAEQTNISDNLRR
jgi:hypothetical protein